MNNKEAMNIILLIHAAYSSFEYDEAKIVLWIECLSKVQYPKARETAIEWICMQKQPPTIADIINHSRESDELGSDVRLFA